MEQARDMRSALKVKKFGVEAIEFRRNILEPENGVLELRGWTSYETLDDEASQETVAVRLTIEIRSQDPLRDAFYLKITTVGAFTVCEPNPAVAEALIKYNTIAIMFPYIREEISHLTGQSGMTPIVLPVIDINQLVDGMERTLQRVRTDSLRLNE